MNNVNQNDGSSKFLDLESTAVQNYLDTLQSIIARMANNSSSCKTWCVTLVSAIIVVVADKPKPSYLWIALLPIILFFFLDAYYLGQERIFRGIYNHFVKRVHDGSATTDELYLIMFDKEVNMAKVTIKATTSFSVYPFYTSLLILLILGRYLIL